MPASTPTPRGMYISAEQPTRSVRSTPGPDRSHFLIVGGEGHKPGDEPDTRRRYERLEGFVLERFGVVLAAPPLLQLPDEQDGVADGQH